MILPDKELFETRRLQVVPFTLELMGQCWQEQTP
jgi:hypothetical protein